MTKDHPNYSAYIKILEEELVPAMGCTEPIALAYCAAKAREVLGALPDRVAIGASGSIIKHVKSVIVPNTNHMKGIPAAAVAGIVAGDASRQLEVIASVTEEQTEQMRSYLEETPITVEHVDNGLTVDFFFDGRNKQIADSISRICILQIGFIGTPFDSPITQPFFDFLSNIS